MPAALAVTFTVITQDPAAGMVPPVRVTVGPVALAVPPQVLDTIAPLVVMAPGNVGNVSVNAALVSALGAAFVLLSVMVNKVVPPAGIEAAANALAMVGRASMVFVSVAEHDVFGTVL